MPVTQADLDDFLCFAMQRLAQRETESLSELLHEWEAVRERRETIASVRRGLVDVEAGRTRPAKEVVDALRCSLNTDEADS